MSKRVLIFSIAYYPFVGGAEVAIKEITDRLPDIEWHMVTCLFDNKLKRKEVFGNVTIHRIDCSKIFFPFLGFWKGRELQKQKPFDVSWSMMTFAGFAGLFFKIFFSKIPFLLSLQEGTPISEIKRKSWFVYPLLRLMFKKADKIQAISNFLATFAKDMGHPLSVEVIPNGVDIDKFSLKIPKKDKDVLLQKLDKKSEDIFLVTTSRLVLKNAIDDIIMSLLYLPKNIKLVVIGKGEQENSLKDLVKYHGLEERVKFLGFIPQFEIPYYFSICDIFVRPSRSEGFGNSFIEAMASKLPVIATPVGGIVDFVDDKETGVFCAPDNPQSIADAINFLLDDTEQALKIVLNAYDRVSKRYDWSLIASDMKERVFDSLLYEKK